jgi:hypothetical protein
VLFSSTSIQIFIQREHLIKLRLFHVEGKYIDWFNGVYASGTDLAQFSMVQRERLLL